MKSGNERKRKRKYSKVLYGFFAEAYPEYIKQSVALFKFVNPSKHRIRKEKRFAGGKPGGITISFGGWKPLSKGMGVNGDELPSAEL
mgnify:CR=1 FL=1